MTLPEPKRAPNKEYMAGTTKIRALLVEDNRLVAQLLVQLLELEEGDNIEVVHKERLADAAVASKQQDFDVMLLDMSLPDSTGMQTIVSARSMWPRTPIVVLTSDDDPGVRTDVMRAGAVAYLVKGDASGKMIAQTIRDAVQSRPRET